MARGPAPLALTLLALAVAGCLAPASTEPASVPAPPLQGLTEAVHELGEFVALKVPSHDGVEIHVDLKLPAGEGPWPAIVEFTPYALLGDQQWGLAEETGAPVGSNGLAEFYVPRGYAVGVAHVRGTGESGGCLNVGGPDEALDGYAVVEHLAAQPWSNGKVALMGTSYVGTTPIQTAVLNPPHLTTIVPISAVTEWYRYYFEHGEQRMNGDPPPGASYPDPLLYLVLGGTPGPRTLAASPEDAACVAEFTSQFWLQDDYNGFWQARNHRKDAANITVPMLYAHGFLDENVATNMVPDFLPAVPAEKRAWLTQHKHGIPASHEDWWSYVHRWLDLWLLERANGALDLPAVVVQDNRGQWRAEATWPPADAAPLRLWLTAERGLAADAPGEGSLAWRDDGTGLEDPPLEGLNHLRFVGEPLAAPLHLAGEPVVHLEAASDATDTQFSVHLYDRAPDGTEAFVTRGYLDARHRDSLEQGQDLAPGTRYAFHWELHARDHVLDAGHRLVVVVKSSDPYIIQDATRATNTLFLGAEGSWLELPTAARLPEAFADEAPAPWPAASS